MLMETVCGPESSMTYGWSDAKSLATTLGPPLFRPMCDGATGIAAAGFGTDTKIFVTVAPGGLADSHQRAIVEFSAAEARSTPLLLNSSTPQQYSAFGLATEFNVASVDQKQFKGNQYTGSRKNLAQMPKRFPGFQVRLSASHGKVITGVTEAWNSDDPDQGLRVHTTPAFCEKLDCGGLNEALKDLQWDAPRAQPGVFVTSEPIDLSISLCSGGSAKRNWKFQLSGTVFNRSELDALVEDRVSCAWPASAAERKVCCTQKFVHGNVSDESMRDVGLGKSLRGDGNTDNAGWAWPDLAAVIPQLDGFESVVAGQSTAGPVLGGEGQAPTASSPQSDFFRDGVGEDALFSANSVYSDAPNYAESMATDYVNGNGLSTTKRGAELDIWLPDRPYTVDANMGERCGSSKNAVKSRIVHVNARTRNATTVLLNPNVSKMFLDVASVALPVGAPTQVKLFVLYMPWRSQRTLAYSKADVPGAFYWKGPLPRGGYIRGSNSFKFEVIRLVVSFNETGNPVPESTTGTPILTISDSNVLPSLAADKDHLYVLTATGLRKYSHGGGSALQTWGSSATLEWPDVENKGLAALYEKTWPTGGGYCCAATLMAFRARMGGQVVLHINVTTGEAQEAYFTTVQGYLYRVNVTATNNAPQVLTYALI